MSERLRRHGDVIAMDFLSSAQVMFRLLSIVINSTITIICLFIIIIIIILFAEEDLSIPAIKIAHSGRESYFNMWQKVRSIWKHIYKHYLDDFDWFLLGGDDMYYIIDNLRVYLQSPDIQHLLSDGKGSN